MDTRAIFFDVDDTLLHFTRDYDDILAAALNTVVGEARPRWVTLFDATFHKLLAACEPSPYRRALDALDVPADTDVLLDELRRQETRALEPPAGVHGDLERLRTNYHLGVLTNGVPGWQRHKLRAHDLDHYFEAHVTAYDVGAHKPAPEPFVAAEDVLPAANYALVGDSEADVAGASTVGWASHRYDGNGFSALPDVLDWG